MGWAGTIRFRLTAAFIAVILVTNGALFLATCLISRGILQKELTTRVRMDLNAARNVYESRVKAIEAFLRATAARRAMPRPLASGVRGDLDRLLRAIRAETGMEMLSLLDRHGRVVYRAHNPGSKGDSLATNPLVSLAMRRGTPVRGTAVIPGDELKREGADLARRAHVRIMPTPGAVPLTRRESRDGMIIGAAVPLTDLRRDGEVVGYLYGANLLNRSYGLIETIKDGVFQEKTPSGKDIGLVTIFLGDLRVSTNVRGAAGGRIIGSRLHASIHRAVLEKRQVWAGRAPVMNDWYIAAYEPLLDPSGKVIGSLAVGVLESPFSRPQETIVIVFLVVVMVTTLCSLVVLFLLTRTILKPIGRIIGMSDRVVAGDLSARVSIRPSGEMGQLCQAIDQMADAVERRERKLEEASRAQIDRSEKLASVGRLAAGVAHEINNPLTGVLTFAHLMREKKDLDEADREGLDVIIRETTRVRGIVRDLLDFARESQSDHEELDVNEVIERTLQLLRSQKTFGEVGIKSCLEPGLPPVCGDRNRLQQVFLNLALNACEAMEGGGTLTVRTSFVERLVVVSIEDTGCGIPAEHLDRVFDPFFTTKPVGSGTGLGLSVSYGIVEQHGGAMDVVSRPDEGTRFDVILPPAAGRCGKPGKGEDP